MEKIKTLYVYTSDADYFAGVKSYFQTFERKLREQGKDVLLPDVAVRGISNPEIIEKIMGRQGKVVVIGGGKIKCLENHHAEILYELEGVRISRYEDTCIRLEIDQKIFLKRDAYLRFLERAQEVTFDGALIADFHYGEEGYTAGKKEKRILGKSYAKRAVMDLVVPFGFAYDAVTTGQDRLYVKDQLYKFGLAVILRNYVWEFLGVENPDTPLHDGRHIINVEDGEESENTEEAGNIERPEDALNEEKPEDTVKSEGIEETKGIEESGETVTFEEIKGIEETGVPGD